MVFLQKFQSDRQGKFQVSISRFRILGKMANADEQFADEKNFLLQKLAALKGGSDGNGVAY